MAVEENAANGWCASVVGSWATFHLHPPVAGKLRYRLDRYLMLVPFGSAVCQAVLDGVPSRRRLRANAVLFATPGQLVDADQVEPVEFLVMTIAPPHIAAIERDAADGRGPIVLDAVRDWLDPGIAALAGEIRRAMLNDSLSEPAYLEALGDALLRRLVCRQIGEVGEPAGARESLTPARLARIARHIDAHLADTIRVTELAELAGLSRSHFSRAFTAATGDPPQTFILRRRVARARELLSGSEDGVAAIAARSGFSSQAHLSTAFAREVGTTPARYRAAFRRDQDEEAANRT